MLKLRSLKRAALGAAFAGAAATSALAQPGLEPAPYEGPRTLPGLWADAAHTGLVLLCSELGCDVVDASTDEAFVYVLSPITVAWEDQYEVTIDEVILTMSASGIDDLQGFPDALSLEINGVGVNEALATEIVGEMGVDPVAAELIARELVNEKLSVGLALAFEDDYLNGEFKLGLLSDDAVALRMSVYLPPSLRAMMTEDRVALDVSVLDIEVPAVRAFSVLSALNPEVIIMAPAPQVQFEIYENVLLDKAYAVALIELGVAGENELWASFLEKVAAVPEGDVSEEARLAAQTIIEFYRDWRQSGRGLRVTISDPRADELTAETPTDMLISYDSPYCTGGVAAGAALPIVYGALPYVWTNSPIRRELEGSSDPHAVGRLMINALNPSSPDVPREVSRLWSDARCTPVISVETFN